MDWSSFAASFQIEQVAWAGLVMLCIFAILSGRLVPARTLDQVAQDRDNWKNAFLESEKANRILLNQNSGLIEAGETTAHLIRSLPHVTGGDKA